MKNMNIFFHFIVAIILSTHALDVHALEFRAQDEPKGVVLNQTDIDDMGEGLMMVPRAAVGLAHVRPYLLLERKAERILSIENAEQQVQSKNTC